jgi:hypothetical protein
MREGGMKFAPPRPTADRWLALVLRLNGAVLLLAAFAVVMPSPWMDDAHRWLGLGPLPEGVIVEYLARSASALYALAGAVTVFLASDVGRYRPLIAFVAGAHVVFGAVMLALDLAVGMPGYWVIGEGPTVALIGVVLLWLNRAGAWAAAGPLTEGG